ncbi:hypothetical protein PVK62_17035, partial [Aliivibrio sp. S3MY1]|uniref:hypothetical protein n=1 Tax=unclassified Aliivibrio TaxID=2645654 RepID=UPI002378A1CF
HKVYMHITNASTRFATFGVVGFFEFTVLSGKFRLGLHSSKRVMQALCVINGGIKCSSLIKNRAGLLKMN